ncbi:MAG: alpha/beta hydrolase [Planctomycetota bacterium]
MTRDKLLPCVEVTTGADPAACVLWLHGLGADGHDFEPIVPHLGLPPHLPTLFVFPHAPPRPVTLNRGMVMRAWYDIPGLELDRGTDEIGIRESAEHIERLLAALAVRGFASERTVIAGFSQGGAMAYHVGLRHAARLAGILVLSAYLPLGDTLEAEAAPANRSTPILQCHGRYDTVVPQRLGERSAARVQELGYSVEWRSYAVEHSVHPQEIADIGRWLTDRLSR